jgi:hypothetical protein
MFNKQPNPKNYIQLHSKKCLLPNVLTQSKKSKSQNQNRNKNENKINGEENTPKQIITKRDMLTESGVERTPGSGMGLCRKYRLFS